MTNEPLAELIMARARALPEGEPLYVKQLLGLGSRVAAYQVLSRLAGTTAPLRVGCGSYVRPIETHFGTRPPEAEKLVKAGAA